MIPATTWSMSPYWSMCCATVDQCDRVGGAVHRENGGFDIALVGGLRRRQGSVHGHDRLHVGAGACEVQDIEFRQSKTPWQHAG